jgi:hypothetical protein
MIGGVKTTIELPDALLIEAKKHAAAHGLTLKEVMEAGLRKILASDAARGKFRLRKCSVGGEGLVRDFTWPEIRDEIYKGRGA